MTLAAEEVRTLGELMGVLDQVEINVSNDRIRRLAEDARLMVATRNQGWER